MTRHARRLVALLPTAAILVATASCQTQPTLEEACMTYAEVFRADEQTCGHVAPEPDETALIARQAQLCVATYGAPGSRVGANYWEDCANVADTCQGYKCPTFAPGTRTAGAPCLASVQCASLDCVGIGVVGADGQALAGAVQCGTCQTRLSAGAACSAATPACAIGLSCFEGACRETGLQGSPCVVGADCTYPFVCRSGGVCGAVSANGQTCMSSAECASFSGCDPSTKVCVPRRFGQAGATCDDVVTACESGPCDKTTGTCPTVLATGAACDPTNPSQTCAAEERCFQGTCRIPDANACG